MVRRFNWSLYSLKRRVAQTQKGEHGQMLVYFAIMLFALIGMAALISDVPLYLRERSRMQAAADSAALAGAMELDQLLLSQFFGNQRLLCQSGVKCQLPASAATPYCAQYAGATCGVSINPWPLFRTVTVTMERTIPTYFSGALGLDGINIRVTATAALTDQY